MRIIRHFDEVQKHLPEGMKIVVMSGKIFTSSWMLMGFENLGLLLGAESDMERRYAELARDFRTGTRQRRTKPGRRPAVRNDFDRRRTF